MYKIILSKSANKFLENVENELFNRIIIKLEKLKENPFPSDCKRIEGHKEKIFRVRVGDYRILYEVLNEEVIIEVIKIDKRSRVYDK